MHGKYANFSKCVSTSQTCSATLKNWWDLVTVEGRKRGYHVKPSKSWLIVKDESKLSEAETIFRDSPLKITTAGKRHLGAALGTNDYKTSYMTEKVDEWSVRMKKLSEMARSQPHAAYAAYIHGEQHKYTYFLRTLHNISDLLEPLDSIINNELIPALFGTNISSNDREILALPIKDGGLGLRIWQGEADSSYETSRKVTAPLQLHIVNQVIDLPPATEIAEARNTAVTAMKQKRANNTNIVIEQQSNETKRNLEQLSETGASSWLGAFPLKEQGFNLNKSEFTDAVNLRYNKPLRNLPSKCPCGKPYDLTHALNCTKGGFVTMRHDWVRDFEAKLLRQAGCKDVQTEPPLQSTNGFTFRSSANTEEGARLDVRAKGFWRRSQNAFFDVHITNVDSESYKNKKIQSVLREKENGKKRQYNRRVMEIEHSTFTPIVLSVKGAMGRECQIYHKALAEKIAEKTGERYEEVTRLIRIKLSFLVLKGALLCLRGSRSIYNNDNLSNCQDFRYNLNELSLG